MSHEEFDYDNGADDAADNGGVAGSSSAIGTQLRRAREARGLSLAQISAETRIAERHLELIETGDFDELPGRTYAIGFAKNYARIVGLSQADTAQAVKDELALEGPRPSRGVGDYDPIDPARVPSSRIGLISGLALILLLGGAYAFYSTYLNPGVELESLTEAERREAAAVATAREDDGATTPETQAPDGPVIFTALEEGVWVKFYDASGAQLMQKQMAEGERYTVPADADGPQVWTGRPDALAITIGGQTVAKLAEEDRIMKDISVTAEALLNRSDPSAAADDEPSA